MSRHLLLVGLSGAGKSDVGQRLAALLGTAVTDVDQSLERQEGLSVAELFAERGEAAFRVLERAVVREALDRPPHVVVPGGGWAAEPGALEEARRAGVWIVWLRIAPGAAAGRLGAAENRPLLAGADVAARLSALLDRREPFYRLADAMLDVDNQTAAAVAVRIAELARLHAGWSPSGAQDIIQS